MCSPISINNVKYFSTPTEARSYYENTPWLLKVLSFIISIGTFLAYRLYNIALAVTHGEKQLEPYTQAPSNESRHQRLVVCLHGLNSPTIQFKKIFEEIRRYNTSNCDLYIPKILDRGNEKLDKMVAPIFNDIAAWAKSGTDKELVLVGISNGGRIARAIEAELINSGQIERIKKLQIVYLVGACKGSMLVNLAQKLHLTWLISKNIAEEMPTNSERFKRLETDCATAARRVNLPERNYTFIASAHDLIVPNYDSTLMEIPGAQAKYAIIPNHGHNSIVYAVAKSIAGVIFNQSSS